MKRKYDAMKEADIEIINRVNEVAEKYNVSMSEVALAWLFEKGVAAPIVGATKISHFNDAVRSVELNLTEDEVNYLEELYLPHKISGAIPNK